MIKNVKMVEVYCGFCQQKVAAYPENTGRVTFHDSPWITFGFCSEYCETQSIKTGVFHKQKGMGNYRYHFLSNEITIPATDVEYRDIANVLMTIEWAEKKFGEGIDYLRTFQQNSGIDFLPNVDLESMIHKYRYPNEYIRQREKRELTLFTETKTSEKAIKQAAITNRVQVTFSLQKVTPGTWFGCDAEMFQSARDGKDSLLDVIKTKERLHYSSFKSISDFRELSWLVGKIDLPGKICFLYPKTSENAECSDYYTYDPDVWNQVKDIEVYVYSKFEEAVNDFFKENFQSPGWYQSNKHEGF